LWWFLHDWSLIIQEFPFGLLLQVGHLESLVGACANYLLASFVGIPAILKFGKYFGITEAKYRRSEKLFLKNSVLYTFLGRLIPVVPPPNISSRMSISDVT
jgi:membrane protein DedA with SNARE-associated domain